MVIKLILEPNLDLKNERLFILKKFNLFIKKKAEVGFNCKKEDPKLYCFDFYFRYDLRMGNMKGIIKNAKNFRIDKIYLEFGKFIYWIKAN